MTKKQLLADIQARKRADAKDRKRSLAEGKRNRRYRLLLKLAGQGRSYEQIGKLTGMTPAKAKRELANAAEWWVEARKHIDENLQQAMNPPPENN